ncbi:MAG: hypothetical protein HY047_11995 [Acidobacteria bacterium]|nr:hypothetical protein [Acidobacteriota bacterium]
MHARPTLSRAVLGGFAGTAAMTAMMYLVAPMMGLREVHFLSRALAVSLIWRVR